ncbi:hypothetical protein DMENIID0001_168280 [Sergentomyia squamirostris]
MNEYKCSSFLTENLLAEMFPSSTILSRRMGMVAGNESVGVEKINLQGTMLNDEGSTGYSNWLTKSSTLEDIYNNYMKKNMSQTPRRRFDNNFEKESEYEEWAADEYEEGDVTGYAVQNPVDTSYQEGGSIHHGYRPPSEGMNFVPHPYGNHEQFYSSHMFPQATAGSLPLSFSSPYFTLSSPAISVDGDSGKYSHSSDFLNTNEIFTSAWYSDHDDYPMQESKFSKALGLKDLFEIALTTLAFLSFGMFILHVIMCITMDGSNVNNMMMMPMEMPAETEEIRGKREAPGTTVTRINEMARIVLMSIDAARTADKDKGLCLHRAICENNKFSRTFKDSTKFWIPLWSLGMTWYSSRVITDQSTMVSIIDSLKAAILGLGGADCGKAFSSCDNSHQKDHKVLVRRKRLAENYQFNWTI